ncbi:C-X-C chemokine receptor type 4a isoform X1 [Chanos chanos]|uniref:C-X-C chemokine receptor type 4a isoform X1 n=1 Tax=Chanos chanos TaxID=29144 RepID=A0A6J2W0U8_CHACN|nr:C-X-C chemokine receptor type 4-like isoform X1 [Chanos chanos]
MSYYEHIIFEDDNSSESGSGDIGSDFDEPCDPDFSQDFKRVFLPTVYGIIFILGLIGNGLVVLVMGCQRKSRTMTDKYRLHLSVADLLFVLSLPFWAVYAASDWYFGSFMCAAVHMIYTVNLYSSVLILAFISLDRYLAVVRATNSHAPRKLLAERVIYVGVWLPAALLTVPDLVFAKAEHGESGTICTRIYPLESNTTWMVVFHLQHILVGFVLPGLVILICYCIIISKLSRGSKGTQKRKALKTTVVLILCFFGCWMPYCGGILVNTLMNLDVVPYSCELRQRVEKWIFITEALAYFHCCLNPILYAFLGVKFKKSARSALSASRGSSLKILPKKRGGMSSVSTESESSSFHSS